MTRFEQVVLPHLDAAYALARYLSRTPADAEDAVQEAVLRALQYLHPLRSEGEARAWLLTIVRRESHEIRASRHTRTGMSQYDDSSGLQLADPAPSPADAARSALLKEHVRAAIEELPEHLRETIVLRELQQCSYEEIATITDAPLGTVMSRLSRARTRLAERLRDVVDVEDVVGAVS